MNCLLLTRMSRLWIAALTFFFAVGLSIWRIRWMSHGGLPLPTDAQLLVRLLLIPGFIALMVLGLLTAHARRPPSATSALAAPTITTTNEALIALTARIVGVQWLNPLHQRDYSTEWELLWALGRTQHDSRDPEVRGAPTRYSKPQSLDPIVNVDEDVSAKELHSAYLAELLGTLHSIDPGMAPTRIDYVISAGRLDAAAVSQEVCEAVARITTAGKTRPEIHVDAGGANAGFAAVAAAVDHLREVPTGIVWVMGWDSPSFPTKHNQINENMVLLILAGTDAIAHREPLAWVGLPAASEPVSKFIASPGGAPRIAQAWKSVLDTTAQNNNCSADQISYAIHDADFRAIDSSQSTVGLAQTLTAGHPEFDFAAQTFNAGTLFGQMGACTALTNIALAVGHANHLGGNVLVAGTSDPERAMAAIVLPPSRLRPVDTGREWFRASGEHQAYLPWQGLRLNEPQGVQGYSD